MTEYDFANLQTRWSFPTLVWFGAGRLSDLPGALAEIGGKAPLIITDRGLAASSIITGAQQTLKAAGIASGFFCEVQPNPTGENVVAGCEVLRKGGHDCVIAIGGGSAMDAAKAVAMMAGQTRPLLDFEDIGDNFRRVQTNGMLPVIALPTTAGTGSEFGRSSVITDTDSHRKVIIFHPKMLPELVILDPELTVGLPPVLTAATGMDALSHALEALCAPGWHPMADGLALTALKMIDGALASAYSEPGNLTARSNMLVASAMACTALQKGLGAVHALAHPLGARYDAHHGMLNAVLMPHVLRFNLPAVSEQMATLAHELRLEGSDPGAAVLSWLETLQARVDMPSSLSKMGVNVDETEIPGLVADALRDPCALGNPIPLNEAGVEQILRAAL
ncbi:alcohol dehydrogenase [Thioclava marina]|uniref:Alcohol dehydrogenase n=1 Tax=Thioclava marina TaxID=1915077 RepID=A0ABX3MK71_9RHOB|nr:iron-containing alcohol dehydrogenase [Thioclava marina]OOY11961.1 alcohol dehydrogenase [Thioclava marina]